MSLEPTSSLLGDTLYVCHYVSVNLSFQHVLFSLREVIFLHSHNSKNFIKYCKLISSI